MHIYRFLAIAPTTVVDRANSLKDLNLVAKLNSINFVMKWQSHSIQWKTI